MTKIAVSSGDPAGIGPDICIKAFHQISKDCLPIFFGNIELFTKRRNRTKNKLNPLKEDKQDLLDELLERWATVSK